MKIICTSVVWTPLLLFIGEVTLESSVVFCMVLCLPQGIKQALFDLFDNASRHLSRRQKPVFGTCVYATVNCQFSIPKALVC